MSQGIFEKKLNVQAGGKGNNASILVIGLALAGAAGSFYRYTKSED
ncbi:LPXTG cell wall anchor domain-containing protein [Enterococcus sp. AZ163]